ncbi:ABC transporter ATP-binding protein [Alkalicaulis satelles]|uniref:ABC transporter ATP-binding protein n=1 Tax=Alkalicaulis satelles TaxID=2609175 RepID=A0A5M6ZG97_9PROT|nr:ABC transporter ATP-binding protein [Alkalicaulis satelles]KAA5803310.1 ABC transporter ATP-binding protein [Alkalicaulis satelles]
MPATGSWSGAVAAEPSSPGASHRQGAALVFSGVSKIYGQGASAVHALDNVDLTIARGEFVAIYGRSGSGKSTFLNLAGALDLPTAGAVTVFGAPPTHTLSRADAARLRNRQIGFIFQQYNLFARFTVAENVETPLVYAGLGAADRSRKVREALALVGLEELAARRPAELSGGQQQRVAVARAIVTGPDMVLADEPTGALDDDTGGAILDHLQSINRTLGVSVALVTHDPGIAERAGRVLTFRNGRLDGDERRSGAYGGEST